jgi:hypothetical protein
MVAATATTERRPARPFVRGGVVGLIVGVVIGILLTSVASRTIAAALRSLRRRATPASEPPFEFLAQ